MEVWMERMDGWMDAEQMQRSEFVRVPSSMCV